MFDLFNHIFAQNAFIAGSIVAIVTAVVGYFTVIRAQAFAGHALSHVGFAGATGAVLIGLNSIVGMLIVTFLTAFGIGALGEKIRGRDIEIGMLLSFVLGCGVLFLNHYSGQSAATVNILFGSILSVSTENIIISAICGGFVLLAIGFLYRPLLFASIDPVVAEARGIPTKLLSIIFLLLMSIVISISVQVIGVLLVFALLIAPAATAERLTSRPLTAMLLAILLGLLYTIGGLALTFVGHWPASFYISALAAIPYFIANGLYRFRRPRRYQPVPHPCQGHATEPIHV